MINNLRTAIYFIVKPIKERVQSFIVLNYYRDSHDHEIKEICTYLRKYKRLTSINYEFTQNDKKWFLRYPIVKDISNGLYYVLYKGQKMYFTKNHKNKKDIQIYLKTLIDEQHQDSPHCYLTEEFQIENGDVVLDAGVAEGNFAIEALNNASRVILVECDKKWIEALKVTFSEEIETGKVVLEEKMLGDRVTEEMTTIDELECKYGHIDFVKMDIEGAEVSALNGGYHWLKSEQKKKIAVCTYHRLDDYSIIKEYLTGKFECETSKGYICINPLFGFKPPYFRRAIIRAVYKKEKKD